MVGVNGNHDVLEVPGQLPENARVLDESFVEIAGLKIGGVGGVIGDAKLHLRRTEADFLTSLKNVTLRRPDIVLLHQGPDDPALDRRGDPMVRQSFETGYKGLTVFWLLSLGNAVSHFLEPGPGAECGCTRPDHLSRASVIMDRYSFTERSQANDKN